MASPGPLIEIISDEPQLPPMLDAALRRIRARVTHAGVADAALGRLDDDADARVIVAAGDWPAARLAALLRRASDASRCAMVVGTDRASADLSPGVHDRAPCVSDAASEDELRGRLMAMCEARRSLRHLARELDAARQGDRTRTAVGDRLDEQLLLASQVQRDLLPDPLPRSSSARFSTLYLPADHVSGDIYDVARLDESHLAISVADATGHGIPAALLTVFLKRSFRGKRIENGSYRILEPDEVLLNLNDDLLDAGLSHCQFVTGLHGVYAEDERVLRWARGGIPYPVHVPRGGGPRLVRSTGVLLGAVESPPLQCLEQRIEPGDRLYFYTDGLEALLCGCRAGANPLDVSATSWFRSLPGREPADVLAEVDDLRQRIDDRDWPRDDITIVCIEGVE